MSNVIVVMPIDIKKDLRTGSLFVVFLYAIIGSVYLLSDIESEQNDIAVLHYIFFALASYKTFFFRRCH